MFPICRNARTTNHFILPSLMQVGGRHHDVCCLLPLCAKSGVKEKPKGIQGGTHQTIPQVSLGGAHTCMIPQMTLGDMHQKYIHHNSHQALMKSIDLRLYANKDKLNTQVSRLKANTSKIDAVRLGLFSRWNFGLGKNDAQFESNKRTKLVSIATGLSGDKNMSVSKTQMTKISAPSEAARGIPSETSIKAKVRGIQKDISPLTTRRVVRRKKTKDSPPKDQEVFDVTAYAVSEEVNLETLSEDLEKQGLYGICALPDDVGDAIHVNANYRVDDEPREIFIFREGSVVFWNMPEVERDAVMRFLRRHQEDSYDSMLIHQEHEHVEFTFTENSTRLVGNEIQLQRPGAAAEDVDHHLEKYTFSNALALSVKLAIWEASLERYVDSIEWVLQDLKEGRKIKISRSAVLQKTGELFTLRHLINLSSDLLDTPDFYWDRERLEQLYTRTCSHMNINRRTKVMNEKLTHCTELTELLISHLNDKHHTRLEWMIIMLILVEVLFETVHMMEKYG